MRRILDTLILAACGPAIAPVLLAIVAREVVSSLVELRRGDRDGRWS